MSGGIYCQGETRGRRRRVHLSTPDRRTGRVVRVSGDGDDWIEATAKAAAEMMQLRRAGIVQLRPEQTKKLAAVALLQSPAMRAVVQRGFDAQRQAIQAVAKQAEDAGMSAARAVASKAEDIAGAAAKAALSAVPGGTLAYEAGVQVWRQVKKIPFIGRWFR